MCVKEREVKTAPQMASLARSTQACFSVLTYSTTVVPTFVPQAG